MALTIAGTASGQVLATSPKRSWIIMLNITSRKNFGREMIANSWRESTDEMVEKRRDK